MERILENFISQREPLSKSFWAGKLLRELKLSEDNQDKLTDYLVSNQEPPSLHTHSASDYQGHSLSTLISEALISLKAKKTCLSPRVHELVTESLPCEKAVAPHHIPLCTLESSATLNWTLVSTYMLDGNGKVLHLIFSSISIVICFCCCRT